MKFLNPKPLPGDKHRTGDKLAFICVLVAFLGALCLIPYAVMSGRLLAALGAFLSLPAFGLMLRELL